MKTEKKTINKKSLNFGLISAIITTIIWAFLYIYIFGIDPFAMLAFIPTNIVYFIISFSFFWSSSLLYFLLIKKIEKVNKKKIMVIIALIVFILSSIIMVKVIAFSVSVIKVTSFDRKLYETSDPEILTSNYPKALQLAIEDEDTQALKNIAFNQATPENLFYEIYKEATTEKISREDRLEVLRFLAQNSATPTDLLYKLYNYSLTTNTTGRFGYEYVLSGLSYNENTPVEILVNLSKSSDPDVRSNVAWNTNTPAETLIELSNDPDPDVRSGVARNKNTPVEIIVKLSKDSDPQVRADVAWGINTPDYILEQLSKDENEWVRSQVKWRG